MTTKTETGTLTRGAGQAVADLEDLPLGDPWADVAGAAGQAISALKDSAAGELFPSTMEPASDAALRDFGMETRALGPDAVTELVAIHAAAIAGGYLELAALIRSPRGRRFVAVAAQRNAHPLNTLETQATAAARAELEALAGFQVAIAGQLVGVAGFDPEAELVARVVPELRGRLDAARMNHEQHAVAALEQIETEEIAAAAAIKQERIAEEQAAAAVAVEAEREAARQRRREHLLRSRNLADRVERGTGSLRLGGDRGLYGRPDIVGRLRAGELSSRWLAWIDAALSAG